MNIVWAALIVAAVTGIAVLAMLALRRRAPDGGYYNDSDRASGVFGVLATGFSVLLGFLIFLGFESYDASRSGAETEALTVAQQVQTAQRLPAEVGDDLTGELVCYARWVINAEWDRMEASTIGEDINPWGAAMFESLQGFEPGSAVEEANYAKWLDQTESREIARQDRIHGAAGIMPTPIVDRSVLHRRDHPRVPARHGRQRRTTVGSGTLHGQRRRRHRRPSATPAVPRRSRSRWCRRSAARAPWNAPCCSSINNSPSSAAT